MKTRSKILFVFTLTVLIFIAAFITFQHIHTKQLDILIKTQYSEEKEVVEIILERQIELINQIIDEIGCREEVINILKTPYKFSINKKINVIHSYHYNTFYIYNKNKELIFEDVQSKSTSRTIIPYELALLDTLDKKHKYDYFIENDGKIYQIISSTIKQTDLSKKDSSIYGYSIATILWDEAYLKKLENFIKDKVVFERVNLKDNTNQYSDSMYIIKQLKDYKQRPLFNIIINKENQIINKIKRLNFINYLFFIGFAFILLNIIMITLKSYITAPLGSITESLENEDIKYIQKLSTKNDEYGDITRMIIRFFSQKKLLEQNIKDKESAEIALKESENKYHSLFKNVNIGIYQSTKEGKFLTVNPELVRLSGYSTAEELMSKNLDFEIYISAEQRQRNIEKLEKNGYLINEEILVKTKSGEHLVCLQNAYIVKDTNGKTLFYEGTVVDITSYKQLQTKVAKLGLAVSQSLDGIIIINTSRKFEFVNQSYAQMHGYTVDEIIGNYLSMCHTEQQIKDINNIKDSLEKTEYFEGEIGHKHKDGSIFYTWISVSAIKDNNQKLIGYVSIARDMTEFKKNKAKIIELNKELAKKVYEQHLELDEKNQKLEKIISELKKKEEAITKSEQLYNKTINSINEWIHVIDKDYNFVLTNDSFIKTINKLKVGSNIIGKNMFEVQDFLSIKIRNEVKRVFETGIEVYSEDIIKINDRMYYTETTKTPVFENGKVVNIVTTIRDISEKKEIERRILSAIIETEEKEKKLFSQDIHDILGALLSTMKIYVNVLSKKYVDDNEYQELLSHLKKMILDAVDNTKNIAYNLTPHLLNDYGLVKAIDSYCYKLNSSGIINIEFNNVLYPEKINKSIEINLFRIILELINNTLKHSGAKNIKIYLNYNDSSLDFEYVDDGRGFDFDKINNMTSAGMGINNIFARVKLMNSVCQFDNKDREGIRFSLKIDKTQIH